MLLWRLKGIQICRGCAGGDWRALARVCAILLAMLAANPAVAQTSEKEIAKAFEDDQDFITNQSLDAKVCSDDSFERAIKGGALAKDEMARLQVWGTIRPLHGLLANCIAEQNKKHARVDYASRSRIMGLLLGWHALIQSEVAGDKPSWEEFTSELPQLFEHAKTYLKFAADHNQPDAGAMLARLEDKFSPKTVSGDTKPDFALSAEEVAGQLGSNEVAFEEKHQRKLLEIHGPVSHLSRAAGRISLFLLGASSKAKDELEDRHDIECKVIGPDELKKITSLKKGMIVKIRGIYKSTGKGNTSSVPLTGCLIVSAKTPTPGVSDPLQ
jgi:hypothetical protein